MNKKEEFKNFVKKNPSLLKHIKTGDMSFQKYYEIYDMYGEDAEAWKDYVAVEKVVAASTVGATAGFLNWLKTIDLDSVQNGVQSIQRVLGVLGDFSSKDTKKEEYKPRPVYKHFED